MLKGHIRWQAIQREYCEGELTVGAIAKRYHVDPRTIEDRAGRLGWERAGLVAAVKDAAYRRFVLGGALSTDPNDPAHDDNILKGAARLIAMSRRRRQGTATKAREEAVHCFERLMLVREHQAELGLAIDEHVEAAEHLTPIQQAALRDRLGDAISLPAQAALFAATATAFAKIAELERKLYGLDRLGEGTESESKMLGDIGREIEEAAAPTITSAAEAA